MIAKEVLRSYILSMSDFAGAALPYLIDERMLRVILNSGDHPYPTPEKLKELVQNNQLGSFKFFLSGLEKMKIDTHKEKQPPGEFILYLMSLFTDVHSSSTASMEVREINDKVAIFAIHTIAMNFPKLGKLCSGLSAQIMSRNESMKQALREEQYRSGQQLMFTAATVGSMWRLQLKFKKRLNKVSAGDQLRFLLNESPDDTDDRRKSLAIARACYLLRDEEFVQKDGFAEILEVFGKDSDLEARFLDTYFSQVVESKQN